MAIPDFQTLMLPLLKLSGDGQEWKVADAASRLADEFSLTQEERSSLLPSGTARTFNNRVAWAKVYLGKAGLIRSTKRAHFTISDQGRNVLAAPPDQITVKFLTRFAGFREFVGPHGTEGSGGTPPAAEHAEPLVESSLTPDEVIRDAHERLEQALSDELLAKVRISTPAFFESIVVRLLVAMGYGGSIAELKKSLVGGGGDGGVDGVIDQDVLGLDRVYIQAKRYADGNTVGSSAIRDFFGSLDRFKATKGLFVTSSTYTGSARETAAMLSKRIVLIDGDQLTRLMIRYNIGCQVEEKLEIKKIDEDFFE